MVFLLHRMRHNRLNIATMKKQSPKCDPCEERFEENIHEIVEQVEGHTCRDHEKKEKEMEKVFEQAGAERGQETGNSRRESDRGTGESRMPSHEERTDAFSDRSGSRNSNSARQGESSRETNASDRTGWSEDTQDFGTGSSDASSRGAESESNASRGFATSGDSERAQSAPNPRVSEESRRDSDAGTPWSHHVVGSVQDADRTAGSEITDTLERTERPEAELPR